MELTREQLVAWFDTYFESCNKNQGPIETVVDLKKWFTDDFQFWMHTPPAFIKPPLSREELLMTFVHPGLHERLSPAYYVVDLKTLVVVVQFELQFANEHTGESWPPLQASAHYHLVQDQSGDLRIKRIEYWVESSPVDLQDMFDLWSSCREKALVGLANSYFAGSLATVK